ncbi:unnamed protein product [Closterium sp. NIES-65]|nr:unnamed protein product [Closterium sp. NIES-65]
MGAGSSQPAHQQHRRSQPARPPQYYPPVPYSVPAGAVPQAPYGHAPYPYGYAYHPQAGGGVSPSSWQHNPHYPHPPPAAPWYGGYPGHAPPPYQVPVPPMMPAPPPPVVAEPQQAVTIRNEVNVKRSSLRLLRDPADPSKHLVAFTFDATTSGSVSVFFAAQEGEGCSLRGVYPHVHTPKVVRFAKGLGQKFVQPSGTGVDLSVIPEEHLFRVSSPSPVYPLVIRTRVEPRSSKSATVASPNSSASSGVSNVQSSAPASASSSEPCSVGSHGVESCDSDPGAPLPPSVQSQMTYAVLEKAAVARTEKEGEGETAEGDKGKGTGELPGLFVVRPVKQKIWVDGTSYEVQEIYGIEQCGRANPGRSKKGEAEGAGGQGSALSDEEEEEEDEVAGKECVICMSAPRDTTVLPCRHMCMCADCAKVLRYQTNKCPICRQPVQSLLEIRVPPRLPSLDGPEPTSPEAQGEAAAERQGHAEACAGPPLAGSDRRADPRSAAAHAGSGAAEEGGSRGHGEASRGVDSAAGRSAVLPFAPGAAAQGRPDAVAKLPGQPASAPKFNQSAGYITVDGRKAYFYWLVEAIGQPDSKPLLLWLNGGPGCSSVGCGLFEEVGPWRVASKAGAALLYNKYAWNRLVNIVFLESPVGVGYSYSNDTSDYTTDDEQTAKDNHAFLVGFVARHPRYAGREFYIAGESYAGHYIPQLAARIIEQNQIQGGTRLNLDFSGIFLGNPFVNYAHDTKGPIQFFYDHGMLSTDLYNHAINCDFTYGAPNLECRYHINSAFSPWYEPIDPYNIYAPYCLADIASARLSASARMNPRLRYSIAALQAAIQQQQQAAQAQAAAGIGELAAPRGAGSSGKAMDPLDSPACMDAWVQRYLRSPAVYRTLRAPAVRASQWSLCSNGIDYSAANQGSDIIPTIAALLDQPIRFWIFAGDADSVVPFTGTRVWIEALGLPVLQPHYPWLMPSGQVGGWATRYDKLTWVTVRGAGHQVPTGKPEEAFVLFQSFLLAQDPPSTAQW